MFFLIKWELFESPEMGGDEKSEHAYKFMLKHYFFFFHVCITKRKESGQVEPATVGSAKQKHSYSRYPAHTGGPSSRSQRARTHDPEHCQGGPEAMRSVGSGLWSIPCTWVHMIVLTLDKAFRSIPFLHQMSPSWLPLVVQCLWESAKIWPCGSKPADNMKSITGFLNIAKG